MFGRRRDRELDEEIAAHLRLAARDHVEAGASPPEADAAARREFGNVALTKEVMREAGGGMWLDRLAQDLRYAVRMLAKRPAGTAVAIATLAVALGANLSVFTIVDRVVFHPLALPDPAALVTIQPRTKMLGREIVSRAVRYDQYEGMVKAADSLDQVAASGSAGSMAVVFGDTATWVRGLYVTPNYFRTLGLSPQAGRDFTPTDDTRDGSRVAIISDRAWANRFGRSRDIVGRTLTMNGVDIRIVGVGPTGFVDTQLGTDPPEVFLPLHAIEALVAPNNFFGPAGSVANGYTVHAWLSVIGRLKPGVTAAQFQAELAQKIRTPPSTHLSVTPLASVALPDVSRADLRRFAALLWGAVALVFIIGVANLAGVLLVRIDERRMELTIRAALGASRARLVRQLLVETAVLVALGGAAAVAVSTGMARALGAFELPGRVRLDTLRAEETPRVLAFACALTALTALLCGIAPAFRGSSGRLVDGMRRTAGASARLAWPRMLVAGQSAFCVVLVFGAVLFLRSVNAAFTTSLGFEPRGVVTAIVNANPRMDWTLSRSRTQAILSRIRALPDVRHAAIGTPLLRQGATTARVRVDGRDEQLELDAVAYDFVSPDYFATLRQPRLAGRDFTAADGAGAQPVAIVSDAMAKRFWPGQSAIGHTVSFLPLAGDARVVGIVGDVKSGDLRDDVRCLVYLDIDQNADWLASAVLAQTAGSTADLARNIHAAVRSVDPDVPVYGLETVDDRLEALLMPQRLGLTLIGFLAAVAIGLTAIGVYGVVARLVAQSEKEIGIRIALGAAGSGVVSAIARRNLMPVAAGVAVGAVGAIWSGRYADRFMYGIHANDATAMAASCAGLLAVAAAAAILPARRALRVNPVDVLRAE